MMEVQQRDIDEWYRDGYIIKELLTPSELDAVRADIEHYMPRWDEYARRRPAFLHMIGNANTLTTPAGWVVNNFPFAGEGLNHVALHPFLIEFVERLFGHRDVALSHSGLTGKYAGVADYDQALHTDFTNNTLAFPGGDLTYSDIPMIVYYTDVTVDLGPTFIVSNEFTRDLPLLPRHRTRSDHPELYGHEVPVTVRAGSVLIYSMRTFHRGSAMRATEGLRWSHSMAFHTAGARWLGSATFQRAGGSPEMDRFITHATPRQREIVGFPSIGSDYWTKETLEGVQLRYPAMDVSPYERAMG